MKITAGLGSVDEYVRYVQAGANEFFCGYVPYEWNKRYGTVLPLNRREVLGVNVQIGSESELRILDSMDASLPNDQIICKVWSFQPRIIHE